MSNADIGESLSTRSANIMEAWSRTTDHLFKSVLKTNRATFAAFGLYHPANREENGELAIGDTPVEHESWEVDRSVEKRKNIEVGDRVEFTKTVTGEDVRAFAIASGDTNPLHLNEEFGDETRFGTRIVHGTLISGLISAALARLPGLTIYLSQDVKFLRPVEIGDRLTAVCEIVEELGDHRYRLSTSVENEKGETVIDGEAVVLIDEKPELRTVENARN